MLRTGCSRSIAILGVVLYCICRVIWNKVAIECLKQEILLAPLKLPIQFHFPMLQVYISKSCRTRAAHCFREYCKYSPRVKDLTTLSNLCLQEVCPTWKGLLHPWCRVCQPLVQETGKDDCRAGPSGRKVNLILQLGSPVSKHRRE